MTDEVDALKAYKPLIAKIARQYETANLEFEDLMQEGSIGLINACRKFDPDRGSSFSGYAERKIRSAISDYANKNGFSDLSNPGHHARAKRFLDAGTSLIDNSGIDADSAEIMSVEVHPDEDSLPDKTKLALRHVKRLISGAAATKFYSQFVSELGGLQHAIPFDEDTHSGSYEPALEYERKDLLLKALGTLAAVDQLIIVAKLQGEPMADIAKQVGLSRQAIAARMPAIVEQLRSFIDAQ